MDHRITTDGLVPWPIWMVLMRKWWFPSCKSIYLPDCISDPSGDRQTGQWRAWATGLQHEVTIECGISALLQKCLRATPIYINCEFFGLNRYGGRMDINFLMIRECTWSGHRPTSLHFVWQCLSAFFGSEWCSGWINKSGIWRRGQMSMDKP